MHGAIAEDHRLGIRSPDLFKPPRHPPSQGYTDNMHPALSAYRSSMTITALRCPVVLIGFIVVY